VSLHRLLTAVWTQHTGTTESGDSGVDNTRGHYKFILRGTGFTIYQRTSYVRVGSNGGSRVRSGGTLGSVSIAAR